MYHALGQVFPVQVLTITLKGGTVAQGTFASMHMQGNSAAPPNSWEGTLKLSLLPDNELVAIDFLDIKSIEVGPIKSPLFP